MSLINDALKKAQAAGKDRQSGNADTGHAPAEEPHSGKPPKVKWIFAQALLMTGVLIIVMSVALFFVISALNKSKSTDNPQNVPASTNTDHSKPTEPVLDVVREKISEPTPAQEQKSRQDDVVVADQAGMLPPKPVVAGADNQVRDQGSAEKAPAPSETGHERPAVIALNPQTLEYVKGIQVYGGGMGRVLLLLPDHAETKAYARGEMLDCGFALKLVELEGRTLVFEDEAGSKYYKSY